MKTVLGYIGLGNMGKPMSRRLLEAGNELVVWNRTISRADDLVAAGAKAAASPKDLAGQADIIFICVSDGPTLKKVSLDERAGLVSGLIPGKIVVNMSPVSPAESSELNSAVEKRGCKLIRGPVTGSTALAENGTLGVLTSGDRETYEKILPYLEQVGKNQFYLGDGEQAVVLKLAVNTMIASTMQMEAEAVVLCEKAGLDVAQVCDVIAGSAAGSPLCSYKAKMIAEGIYDPAFTVKLMMKDLDLAFDAAKQYGVSMPVTAITRQQLQAAAATGKEQKDFSVLTQVLEEACGYQR